MFVKTCEFCERVFPTKSTRKRYCSRRCAHIAAELKQMNNEQLCWRCQKACGGCSWSRNFEPVEGWEATPTVVKDSVGDIDSYKITGCPEFVLRCK